MERIGKYIIHQAVVTAGYDRIFLCHDPDLQVPVAVKLFNPLPESSCPLSPAQQQARFLTEARVLASFDHPYIIGVKVMEQMGDGRPYFVMPYMAAHLPYEIGKDFTDPVEQAAADERDKPRRMAPPRALLVLKQLASATLALHRRNLVHRFIKPTNILLTATQNGTVKLCDFSMIKLQEKNLPMPDHWMGGVDYTAPEQRENATSVTPRADVYSLGIIAHRVLTGRLPDPTREFAELPGDFPPQLVSLVAACTQSDPAKRPAHAGEVLAGLDQVPLPRTVAGRPEVKVLPSRKLSGTIVPKAAGS
ncbi:serine/threonine protein kinase [Paramagnetospirillum marisnigri]|uniref:Serine/threonine protein kinase n=2 Tax=Paramagnetospirillum marisnigri TaxID=1285242 RepID=A0A178MMM6_9PROT|nr:serine/threonine protein kinase [Paramagnetospirillum marisnigri]